MPDLNRRAFLQLAAAIGATAVWGEPHGTNSRTPWRERRDLCGCSKEIRSSRCSADRFPSCHRAGDC